MNVVRIAAARPYDAPKHFGMVALRLHGMDASPCSRFSVGVSYFLPGGRAEMSAGRLERVYVVLEGEICVAADAGEVCMSRLDSCWIPPGENRAVINRTNSPATVLVIVAAGD